MAEAKITLQTIVDDQGLQDLNKELANGQQEVKRLKTELRHLEKETHNGTKATKEQADKMRELNQRINEHTQANKALNKQISGVIGNLNQGTQALSGFGGELKNMLGMLPGIGSGITSVAAAVVAVGGALINSGREVSAFANQFIAFSNNAKEATNIYNKFNEVYRNTNYDEQKVYDMGKALLAVGINSSEAADLIMKTADAAASLGKGVEFAEELNQAFIRLATGGELTDKQLKAMAESGIDLSDVQDQIKAGGVEAYEALKQKLSEYEGGMARTKGTSAEMEQDIVGNCKEILRMTSILIDEFFGFSDALRGFYQWVIDTTGTVISSIKNMINTLRNAKAAADDYADAMAAYGEIDEDDPMAVAQREQWIKDRCDAMAAERREAEALAETYEGLKIARVQSIAGSSSTGSRSSGGSVRSAGTSGTVTTEPFSGIGVGSGDNLGDSLLSGLNSMKEMMPEFTSGLSSCNEELQKQWAFVNQVSEAWKNYQVDVGMKLGTTFAEMITGAKSAGQAMKDLAKNLIESAVQMMMQWASVFAIVTMFSGPKAGSAAATKAVFGIDKFADGGLVGGVGSPRSDSNLAMLSKGEYVLNARAVDALGVGTLDALNNSKMPSAVSGGNVTLNVSTVDASSFGDFLSRGGLDAVKQALYSDDREFGATVGVW